MKRDRKQRKHRRQKNKEHAIKAKIKADLDKELHDMMEEAVHPMPMGDDVMGDDPGGDTSSSPRRQDGLVLLALTSLCSLRRINVD